MATRILYVITKASWGGAQRYVYDLAIAARDAGNEVAVVYGEEGELAHRLREAGIRTTAVSEFSRDVELASDVRAFFGLLRLMKHERPDVVHINSSKAGGLGCLAARLARIPLILFTAHGWAFNESRPRLQRALIWILSGVTVALSHKTVCVSGAARRDLRHFPFIGHKMSVIHNGIACSPPLARAEARRILLPEQERSYWIGMMSELHPTKRVDDAIRAMAILVKKFPHAILVVLGEGSERERLEKQIADAGLSERVFLRGFVRDAATLLSAFDLFLHASRSEALAYAVLEAGCASLPVVATRVGGIPEIIPDDAYGLLVPPHDPEALATAMLSLMNDAARAESLGAALHARVLTAFSKEKMIQKTVALYR